MASEKWEVGLKQGFPFLKYPTQHCTQSSVRRSPFLAFTFSTIINLRELFARARALFYAPRESRTCGTKSESGVAGRASVSRRFGTWFINDCRRRRRHSRPPATTQPTAARQSSQSSLSPGLDSTPPGSRQCLRPRGPHIGGGDIYASLPPSESSDPNPRSQRAPSPALFIVSNYSWRFCGRGDEDSLGRSARPL